MRIPWKPCSSWSGISALMLAWAILMVFPPALLGTEQTPTPSTPALAPAPVEEEKSGASAEFPRWWGQPPAMTEGVLCRDPGQCATCHEANTKMDASHAIECVRCHGGNPHTEDQGKAHTGIIKDPGDLRVVQKTCGTCHPDEARRVRGSSMALAPRMINHTRFAFGGQKTSESLHAVTNFDGLEQVPHPSHSGNLGDDLLRRSCLRCHLYTTGSSRWGEHRGQGCSACHVPYPNSSDGTQRAHTLVRNTGMTACLKCHNSNHVGGDYVGLFEKDYHRGFRSPIVGGHQASRIYGSDQHRLLADVHFRAGMQCTDCHLIDEVHGPDALSRSPEKRVQISCEGCHVRGDHPAVLKNDNGEMTLLKGEGRRIPAWNATSIPHKVESHRQRLECSACHAAWSYQDYGFHLMLEERPDYWKWAPTAAQNDPQIQEVLRRNVGTYAELIPPRGGDVPPKPMPDWEPPSMKDWLTGETRPGAWFRGFTVRRWERPPLGLNHRGKVAVMRPMYQYVVSHVDSEDTLLLDRHVPSTGGGFPALIFNPYTPHTTSKVGRPCHECHGSPKAAGLGEGMMGIAKPGFTPVWKPEQQVPGHEFFWDALADEKGVALQQSSHPGAGPLDGETIKRLLNPSDKHRALWYRYLGGGAD